VPPIEPIGGSGARLSDEGLREALHLSAGWTGVEVSTSPGERSVPHRLDRHGVHASSRQKTAVGVAQVMEVQRPQAGGVAR
jgi:hypothetical protein